MIGNQPPVSSAAASPVQGTLSVVAAASEKLTERYRRRCFLVGPRFVSFGMRHHAPTAVGASNLN
jgi:hypothetical protein